MFLIILVTIINYFYFFNYTSSCKFYHDSILAPIKSQKKKTKTKTNGCKQKYSSAKLVSFTAVFSVTTQRSDCMTTLKPAAKETSAKHQLLNLFMVTNFLRFVVAHEYGVVLCRIPQWEFLRDEICTQFPAQRRNSQ